MVDYFQNVLRVAQCTEQVLNGVPRMGATISGRRRRHGRTRRKQVNNIKEAVIDTAHAYSYVLARRVRHAYGLNLCPRQPPLGPGFKAEKQSYLYQNGN
jgi:hypothetical protein